MKIKHVMECCGSATVGERGQIVLPVELRKQFRIKQGDKLLVLSAEMGDFQHIVLMKTDTIASLVGQMTNIGQFLKKDSYKNNFGNAKRPMAKAMGVRRTSMKD